MSQTSSVTAASSAIAESENRLLEEYRATIRRNRRRRIIDRIILTVVVCGAWEVVVRLDWVHAFFISQPSKIFVDLWNIIVSGYIIRHLAVTLYEAMLGLALGLFLGVVTGVAAAMSRRISDALQPLLVAFNSMPRIALAPLFIIWFGFGPESKIGLAALVVFFIVFFNTFSGMKSVEPVLINNVRAMGGTRWDTLRFISLPFTWAWVFAAMKTSISNALIGAVVGEFVGAQAGIGWVMMQASGVLDTTRLFSSMIILAFVGAMLFIGVRATEDRVLHWRPHAD